MARERWFFAQGNQRRGPVPFNQLVESMLGQPDPRSVLVWRKGFADWTRAEDVPEVERRLAPFLARKAAEEAARRVPVRRRSSPRRRRPVRVEEVKPGQPGARLRGHRGRRRGAGPAGAWLFWPRPSPRPARAGAPRRDDDGERPGGRDPGDPRSDRRAGRDTAAASPPPRPRAPPRGPRPRRWPTGRAISPTADLRKLRGVATWAGDTLKLTVYNGTAWRVTELYVRIGRFQDDDFVEDPRPVLLVPPGGTVDAGVADLLSRVAPDRKKPGLNPADTGAFEGKAGQQPENFRWEIESARGYAPR